MRWLFRTIFNRLGNALKRMHDALREWAFSDY